MVEYRSCGVIESVHHMGLLFSVGRYATEHRCGVVVSGPGLSGNISGSDPLKDNRLLLKVKPLDDTKEAAHTANVVNELSDVIRGILRSHPLNAERLKQGKAIANIVLLRGCGIRIDVNPLTPFNRPSSTESLCVCVCFSICSVANVQENDF
jgi:2,3-bisphosphoglycerate-independent phosphoglycerate mutase